MNNFFLAIIVTLLVLSGTLLFFYVRDVLGETEEEILGDCVPINLQIDDILSTSFYVNWQTSVECLGLIKYGDSVDSMNYMAIDESDNIAKKQHSIQVKDLKSSSIYYIVVFSEGMEYGVEGTPIIISTKAF